MNISNLEAPCMGWAVHNADFEGAVEPLVQWWLRERGRLEFGRGRFDGMVSFAWCERYPKKSYDCGHVFKSNLVDVCWC